MFRDFPKTEMDEAIARAHLGALIRERGEDYLCGENDSGLSGGEKQRISIARSLLKKSSVLLADEVTAALDAQTAHRFQAIFSICRESHELLLRILLKSRSCADTIKSLCFAAAGLKRRAALRI